MERMVLPYPLSRSLHCSKQRDGSGLSPNFIPVLGYLDDRVLLLLGIVLFIKLTPTEVITVSWCPSKKPHGNAQKVVDREFTSQEGSDEI